jgi:hypothetical protein
MCRTGKPEPDLASDLDVERDPDPIHRRYARRVDSAVTEPFRIFLPPGL